MPRELKIIDSQDPVLTMPLADGIRKFVETVDEWSLQAAEECAPRPVEFQWMVDTASTDVTHLNHVLAKYGGWRSLVTFFGKYADVYNTDRMKDVACALTRLSPDELHTKFSWCCPVNSKPHDPEADAVHIFLMWCFYRDIYRDIADSAL